MALDLYTIIVIPRLCASEVYGVCVCVRVACLERSIRLTGLDAPRPLKHIIDTDGMHIYPVFMPRGVAARGIR